MPQTQSIHVAVSGAQNVETGTSNPNIVALGNSYVNHMFSIAEKLLTQTTH